VTKNSSVEILKPGKLCLRHLHPVNKKFL